jgi:hypothetical protein
MRAGHEHHDEVSREYFMKESVGMSITKSNSNVGVIIVALMVANVDPPR